MDSVLLKESLAVNNSNRMCRLCLSANGVTEPIGYNQNDQYLLQKIYECTTIQITPLAGLPSVLCTICRARLEDFYQFRWQCIKNDEIIHRIAAGLNTKTLTGNGSRTHSNSANVVEHDKRIQETAPVYSTAHPGSSGMLPQSESSPHHQGLQPNETTGEGYSSFASKFYHPTSVGLSVTETPISFRRKRGRPPKQQFDFSTHLTGNKQQPSMVGESLHRRSESGWNDEQNTPAEVPRMVHEPSGSSSENQEGQEWFKIKVEQIDHQAHPTRNDLIQQMPTTDRASRQTDISRNHSNSASSEQLDQMLASPDSQTSCAIRQTGVKRGRGRPPREGGCPNEDREEYRFRCQYCSARFKAAINLKLHTNTHTGEKPYLCSICNKSFAHPSNLSVHMKLHSNQQAGGSGALCGSLKENGTKPGTSSHSDKKFQCPYCQTLFALAFQLKIHINTHTGQKPYVCKSCGKGFAQPSNLHVHSKKHCRRKEVQFQTGGDTQSSSNYPQPSESTPTLHASETHSTSLAFGRISPFQHHGSSMSQMLGDPSSRSSHHPMNIDESQRNNHSAVNANHVMLV